MDLRQIKNLIKEFELSNIQKLELSDNEFTIKLEKNDIKSFSQSSPVPDVRTVNHAVLAPEEEIKEEVNDYIKVKAPLVGTYYESPSPDSAPFVRVNDHVKQGDTLFIIEAMKVMNEITAPINGKVMSICKEDSDLVEFGQIVMEIKP